ncbi:MAG: hypothetical protein Q8Q41_04240 [bacterium]|nr:hypothetical protein [bacterium]
MKDEKDLAAQGQDHADEMWQKGLCLSCGEPNDQKGKNLRYCSKCIDKEP